MVVENITGLNIPVITPFINTVKVLVGGLFGLYLILVLLRWKEYMMVRKFLKDMRHDLRQIGQKIGVKTTSEHRPRAIAIFKEKIKTIKEKNANKDKRRNSKKI